MKLKDYILERFVNKILTPDVVSDNLDDFIEEIERKCHWSLPMKYGFKLFTDKDKSAELSYYSDTKTVEIKNCSMIDSTIYRWNKFFDTGFSLDIKTPCHLAIRSGGSLIKKGNWPYLEHNKDIEKIIKKLIETNPDLEINTLKLDKFNCKGYFPIKLLDFLPANDILLTDPYNIKNLEFLKFDRSNFKNKNIKLHCTLKMGQYYLDTNFNNK